MVEMGKIAPFTRNVTSGNALAWASVHHAKDLETRTLRGELLLRKGY